MATAATASAQMDYNPYKGPWIFHGYRSLPEYRVPEVKTVPDYTNWEYNDGTETFESLDELEDYISRKAKEELEALLASDTDFRDTYALLSMKEKEEWVERAKEEKLEQYLEAISKHEEAKEARNASVAGLKTLTPGWLPDWLRKAMTQKRIMQNLMYATMVTCPDAIEFAYWNLPEPPRLPEEDHSFTAFIKSLNLPEISEEDTKIATATVAHRHWLHNATAGVQFSQAYVSANWYQGGNNYLALLLNALWDVQLNNVYHPNVMLQSTVSYKLGINSTPPDSYHKYSISEDLLQWNFKTGLKAFRDFFWSYNLMFKTQLLRNYESNSDLRTASFLSPGELNMGLGMTYNYTNKYKTLKIGVSLSPLSYNLKTCIDNKIDPTKFNIEPGHKAHSEIGTNLEVNAEWSLTPDISCRNRLFAFTDYSYFLGDLETTWNFQLNRFLSTQIYAHLRFDSSTELTGSKWKHWMLKEILSFGLTYTFSTKP